MSDVSVEEIPFNEYLELKKKPGFEGLPFPGITVGPGTWSSCYINKKAKEMMGINAASYLAAAPNPDAHDDREFFICEMPTSDGWSVSETTSGAQVSRGLIARCGDQFDAALRYELKETDMVHPEWNTRIYLGIPREESDKVIANDHTAV